MSWPEPLPPETYVLRLFVAGNSIRSQRAVSSLRSLCDEHLKGRVDLEVIDVYTNPEETRAFQIIATPTLVKVRPEPPRRIIGDMSNFSKILTNLNITPSGGPVESVS